MNRLLYSLLLILLLPLLLAYLGWRALRSPDYRGRLGERFALTLPRTRAPLIIHCASMGETLAALGLIRTLKRQRPDMPILVTTTTPTGSAQVRQHLGDLVDHCYLPLDLGPVVARFLGRLTPIGLVLMETELWPNLVHHCHKRQIPVVLANARLSERSARGYGRFPALVGPMLGQLTAIAAQNSNDGARLVTLGAAPAGMTDCGSLKFDIAVDDAEREHASAQRLQLMGERPCWLAASTHPGEFELALAAHKTLLEHFPDLLLMLVPRHPEQFDRAAELTRTAGLTLARRSAGGPLSPQTQVLIGDTMGELKTLCGMSDIALVGGSLIERGGHNPLEPAAFGKPVLMGPHYFNFKEIGDQLKQEGVMLVVEDEHSLVQALDQLLGDDSGRQRIGQAALQFMARNRGATERQAQVVLQALGRTEA
ncbi:3-deoxy-D-manno-octulosonic acid transferase [Ferrimonas sediminicola]|uniref:3-deoxy-D-manno-octulosonic acid transferase n=1 Tax=Ferrimonas sediminicola TaxID=2569538 RepID=A0A4U1BA86_9GAMM|nr:lipid IV(A) 3-deoxy-D-manno-octulosonic acid transferase [Ferrimonas sediminicola]TKB47596.1 3-deoxy-D-manno-octulosonic acid transferase [Ferrimonas sediminicola]